MGLVRMIESEQRKQLIEKLASLEHEQWVHWMKYLSDNDKAENWRRWNLLMELPYSALTDKQKESDRKWAQKAVVVFEEGLEEIVRKMVLEKAAETISGVAVNEAHKKVKAEEWNEEDLQLLLNAFSSAGLCPKCWRAFLNVSNKPELALRFKKWIYGEYSNQNEAVERIRERLLK